MKKLQEMMEEENKLKKLYEDLELQE